MMMNNDFIKEYWHSIPKLPASKCSLGFLVMDEEGASAGGKRKRKGSQ